MSGTAATDTTTAAKLECAACAIDLPQTIKELDTRAFMIVVQVFQDPYTLDVKQLMKCCVEEITPDGADPPDTANVGHRVVKDR